MSWWFMKWITLHSHRSGTSKSSCNINCIWRSKSTICYSTLRHVCSSFVQESLIMRHRNSLETFRLNKVLDCSRCNWNCNLPARRFFHHRLIILQILAIFRWRRKHVIIAACNVKFYVLHPNIFSFTIVFRSIERIFFVVVIWMNNLWLSF